jgi:hypothetical protein
MSASEGDKAAVETTQVDEYVSKVEDIPEAQQEEALTPAKPEVVESIDKDNEQSSAEERKSLQVDPASVSPANLAQLRKSLVTAQTDISRLQDRNIELEGELAECQSKLSDVERQNQFLSASKEAVETELKEEKRKREAAEENVETLRGSLDDARKAIGSMRKGEEKRASTINHGLGMGLADGFLSPEMGNGEEFATSKKVKRASLMFTQGNRRVSGADFPDNAPQTPATTNMPSVPRTGLRELRLGSNLSPPSSPNPTTTPTLANSGFSDPPSSLPPRQSPQQSSEYVEPTQESFSTPRMPSSRPRPGIAERLSSLTSMSGLSDISGSPTKYDSNGNQFINLNMDDNQVQTLESEVSVLRAQLMEAKEARVASEECLKALREFIAMQNGGSTGTEAESSVQGIKLPPLPTDMDAEEVMSVSDSPVQEKKSAGWSLGGYWKSTPAIPPKDNHHTSHANSIATSVRSEAGDVPSASSSVRNMPYESVAAMPLSSFVSSWSRGITGGPPGTATGPTSPSETTASSVAPGLTKRSFSFFGSRKQENMDEAKKEAELVTAEMEKAKQTPEDEMDKDENALRRVPSGQQMSYGQLVGNADSSPRIEFDASEFDAKRRSTDKEDRYEAVAL